MTTIQNSEELNGGGKVWNTGVETVSGDVPKRGSFLPSFRPHIVEELNRSENTLVTEVGQVLAYKVGITNPLMLRAYQGVVTLRGQVPDEETLSRAEETVLEMPGVRGVIDGLKVKAGEVTGHRDLTPSSNSLHFSGWYLPRGEASIQKDAIVYATNGIVGRVSGLIYQITDGTVRNLLVARRKGLNKTCWEVPFEYVKDGYYSRNPELYLNLDKAGFKAISEDIGTLATSHTSGQPGRILSFGKKTLIHYGGEKPGWLGGVLLQGTSHAGEKSRKVTHYLLKTGDPFKTFLLPFETLEITPDGRSLHPRSDLKENLLYPTRFNGFETPEVVIERVLEGLALTRIMQKGASWLRVNYREGEITLEGVVSDRASIEYLTNFVKEIQGVRQVSNRIKTSPG